MDEQDFGGARPKVRPQRPQPQSYPQPSTSASPDSTHQPNPERRGDGEHPDYGSPYKMFQDRPAIWMGSPTEPVRLRQGYRGSPERRKQTTFEEAKTYRGSENEPLIEPNLRQCNMCEKLFAVSENTPSSVCTRCIPAPKPETRDSGNLRRIFRSAQNLFNRLPIVKTCVERRRTTMPTLFDMRSMDELRPEQTMRDYWQVQSVSRLYDASDHLDTLEEWELHIPIERALHSTYQIDRPKGRLHGYSGCGVSSDLSYTSATAPCEIHRLGHPDCWMSQEFKDIPPTSYERFWVKYTEARPKAFMICDSSGKLKKKKDKIMRTKFIYYPKYRRESGARFSAIEEDECYDSD